MLSHVGETICGQPLPQVSIAIRPENSVGKSLRAIRDQDVDTIGQVHSLDCARRRNDGLAVRHAQVDFALDARTVSQRRYCKSGAFHPRNQVRDVTVDYDAGDLAELPDAGICISANAVEDDLRSA